MIRLSHVDLRRGPRLLLEGADVAIHTGWHVAFTGANGCGKSSLLAALSGRLSADAGDVVVPAGWRVAVVEQELPAADVSAADYVIAGDAELWRHVLALRHARAEGDGEAEARAHHELELLDGHTAETRAGRLLHGLGFSGDDPGRVVRDFSGGWQMRLKLARALMAPSELLLLDEPTNHLDLDAILWLEGWLRRYPGTLIVVSHDRDFLDGVADHTLHLAGRKLRLYEGGYSAFERQRAEQARTLALTAAKQRREAERLKDWIARNRARASTARQAQSRIKTLEKMQAVAEAHADAPFTFRIRGPERLPRPLLTLDRAVVGYGGNAVIRSATLSLYPGDRVALLGRNGAGKSTLVQALAGRLSLMEGERTCARGVSIGYFAQHQLALLVPEDNAIQHLLALAGPEETPPTERECRDYLGGWGYSGDKADLPVGRLSGGERARLVLALIAWQTPGVLLLDEPTNHLDLEMRHALTLAMQDYPGAVVLVSHDRHLIRATADSLMEVRAGRLASFEGDLDTFTSASEGREHLAETKRDGAKAKRQAAAERRRALAPLRKAASELEAEVGRLTADMARIDAALADPGSLSSDGMQAMLRERAALTDRLSNTESRWLQAMESLEAAEAS